MTASTDPPEELSSWGCHAGDVTFAVTAPSAWLSAQRAYLSEFLTAPPGELELGGFSIRAHTDDTAYHQTVETINSSSGTNQVEPVRGLVMRECVQPGGHRLYMITRDDVEHHPGAYAVTVYGRHINLLTHSGTVRPHRYPIRLIREAMLRTYEDAGGVIFHAAGIDVGGAAVMVCGPRGAGKTTITAALLRRAGAALLSNDRLIAHQGDHVVAVPLPVPAGRGTIEAFPELRRLAAVELSKMPAQFASTVKHAFTARGFARAFGAGLVSASVARLVVVAQLTDTDKPARVRQLRAAPAGQIIAQSCFTPRDEFWVRPWLIPRRMADEQLRDQARTAIGHITAALPCVTVSFGVRNAITELARTLNTIVGEIR